MVTLKHLPRLFKHLLNSTSSVADLLDDILNFELKSRVQKELWMKTLGNLISQCFTFAVLIHSQKNKIYIIIIIIVSTHERTF